MLLRLLAAVPIGILVMSRNFGVTVSTYGISDRAATGSSDTPWTDVLDFVVKFVGDVALASPTGRQSKHPGLR